METQATPGDWIQRQATSRPWYTERTKTDSAITSADGINVGHMNKEVCAQDCVRAVNNHGALVDALEHAVIILHSLANPASRSAEGMKRGRSEARRGENLARAALDKAKEA